MSAVVKVDRVPFLPEVWMVPATLADFECEHGRLEQCVDCAEAERQDDEQLELDLEVRS